MDWEPDGDTPDQGRDWAKYMRYAIGIVVVVMLATLFFPDSDSAPVTRAHVRHILIEYDAGDMNAAAAALQSARDIRQRIIEGDSFATMAEEFSSDPQSAKRGGDLGWTTRGEFSESIDEVIWTIPINEISDVILTNYGFHVLEVLEREVSDAELYERELQERIKEETTGVAKP